MVTVALAQDREPEAVLIDTTDIPGGGRLHLLRRGDDYEIAFGEEQLMGNWAYRSEQALATLVSERIGDSARRILIGGLSMGFTLAAARTVFREYASIMVAELVPRVVAWARGALAHIVGGSLDAPRVTITVSDVHDVIIRHVADLDVILLDVDNGPDGLISLANERLYCRWGLRAVYTALRPGGMLAVWSAYPDQAFAERLRDVGFAVEEVSVKSGAGEKDPDHMIWLATRPRS